MWSYRESLDVVGVGRFNAARRTLGRVVLALSLLIAPLSGFAQDAYEPDNTVETAQGLWDGVQQAHGFHQAADADWMVSTVGGSLRATWVFTPAAPTATNKWHVQLWMSEWGSTTRTPVASGDFGTGALTLVQDIPSNVTGRAFWATVTAIDPNFIGAASNYNALVTTSWSPDAYEPDGTSQAAQALFDGVQQSHNFHQSGDADWMVSTVGGGYRATWTLNPVTATTSNKWHAQLWMSEWGSTTPTSVTSGDFGVQGLTFEQDIPANLTGRVFWVTVTANDSSLIGPPSRYTARVDATWTPDAYEPDNSIDSPRSLFDGVPQAHNFHLDGDQDWMVSTVGGGLRATWTLTPTTLAATNKWRILIRRGEWNTTAGASTIVEDLAFGTQPLTLIQDVPANVTGRVFWVKIVAATGGVVGPQSRYTARVDASWTPDAFEADNTLETAKGLFDGVQQAHNLHQASDIDWTISLVGANYRSTYTVTPVTATATNKWHAQLWRREAGATTQSVVDQADFGIQPLTLIGDALPTASRTYYLTVYPIASGFTGPTTSYTSKVVLSQLAAPPTVTIAANPSTGLVAPATTTLSATVSVSAGVSGVAFQHTNGTPICTGVYSAGSGFSCAWNSIAAGSYSVRARATVNGQTYDSPTLNLTVAAPPSTASATRTYVYDTNQRLCKVINPESGATIYDYDGAGNVAWSVEGSALTGNTCDRVNVPAGDRIVRQYDELNRLTGINYPGTTADVFNTYEADGALSTTSTAGNTWTYTYNKRRLLTQESLQVDGGTYNVGYGYNANGHLSSMTYPDGVALNYAPNALGQPTQAGNYAYGISYYPNGAIHQFNYGNGIAHEMTPNERQLPERSYSSGPGGVVLDDNYAYDGNGNVTYITDMTDINSIGVTSRHMTYDDLDRLETADAPGLWGVASYTYDALDNLRTADQGLRHYRYVYNSANNRLTQINNDAGVSQMTLGYNAAGDVTTKGASVYTFDAAHRLLSVHGVADYVYDGHGRRVKESKTGSKNAPSEIGLYNRAGQKLYRKQNATGVTTRYVYLAGTQIAEEDSNFPGQPTYKHTDALGSVVADSVLGGTIQRRYRYAPYGESLNLAAGTFMDGLGYTGHEMDADTGLTYMQQRYYDPKIGRFLSGDPQEVNSENGENFNRYWYANSNPYFYVDPDGRTSQDKWYGFDDKAFKDWLHKEKQDENRRHDYDKEDMRKKHEEWKKAGKPRGKGGKSARGAKYRGARGATSVGYLMRLNVLISGLIYSPDLLEGEQEWIEENEIRRQEWLARQGVVEVGEISRPESRGDEPNGGSGDEPKDGRKGEPKDAPKGGPEDELNKS